MRKNFKAPCLRQTERITEKGYDLENLEQTQKLIELLIK